MKANLIKLMNIKEKLEEKLEAMEWAADERSERWHESEAAEIHEDKMSSIDNAIMSIDEAIDELAQAFNLEDFI